MALESILSKPGLPGSPTGSGDLQIGLSSASLGDMQRLNQIGGLPAAFGNAAGLFGDASAHAVNKLLMANRSGQYGPSHDHRRLHRRSN